MRVGRAGEAGRLAWAERRSGRAARVRKEGGREEEGRRRRKEENGERKRKIEKGKRKEKEKERKRKRERAIVLRRRLRPRSNEGHREMGRGLEIGWRDRERIPGIRVRGRRFLSSTMKDFENYI